MASVDAEYHRSVVFCRVAGVGVKYHRLVVLSLFVTILVSSKQENYKTPLGGFCCVADAGVKYHRLVVFCRAVGVGVKYHRLVVFCVASADAEYHRLVVFLSRGRRGRGIPPFGGIIPFRYHFGV